MEKARFVHRHHDELSIQSREFLTSAQNAIQGYFTLDMAISEAAAGIGLFYDVLLGDVLVGSLFIDFRVLHLGKTMQLALLGGTRLADWRHDLVSFLYRLARNNKADEFTIFGRPGWGRLFPELNPVGCIFRKKLT